MPYLMPPPACSPPQSLGVRLWAVALGALVACCVASCCPCMPELDDAKCEAKKRCTSMGECTLRTHHTGDWFYTCYASSEEDCRRSTGCTEHERCYPNERGRCVRKEDVDKDRCASSDACKIRGSCTPYEGVCIATTPEHCRASARCKGQGRCTLRDQHCHATNARDCQRSTGCALDGLCAYDGSLMGNGCILPKRPDACVGSVACDVFGRCVRRPYHGCDQSGERGCGLYYCAAAADEPGPNPCVHNLFKHKDVCLPDAQCVLNADETCVPFTPPRQRER